MLRFLIEGKNIKLVLVVLEEKVELSRILIEKLKSLLLNVDGKDIYDPK